MTHVILIHNVTGGTLEDLTKPCGITFTNMDRIVEKPFDIDNTRYTIVRTVRTTINHQPAIRVYLDP